MLEKEQRRATKMVDGFKDLTYEQRLRRLNITTLETRRLRGDLIEVFQIVKGFYNVDFRNFFHLSITGLRGHSLKIFKPSFRMRLFSLYSENNKKKVILTDNYATPSGRRVRTRDRLLANEIMPSDVATRSQ